MTVTGMPWKRATPPRMAGSSLHWRSPPLLEEVGEQGGDGLVNVGAVRVPGQKDPVLGGQRAAGTQDLVLLYGKLCQLGGVGRDGVHVVRRCPSGR